MAVELTKQERVEVGSQLQDADAQSDAVRAVFIDAGLDPEESARGAYIAGIDLDTLAKTVTVAGQAYRNLSAALKTLTQEEESQESSD